MIEAVVSDHMNPFRSGVARFNELLAERLGVPFLPVADAESLSAPLLSFKVSELAQEDAQAIERALPRWSRRELFLHELSDLPLERRLIDGAQRVLCGNGEIADRLRARHDAVQELWTPGLIVTDARIAAADVVVFTFGMAHKIRVDWFRRLRDLLDASGRSYAVRVSAANHETATLHDAELIFRQMEEVFPERMYFLGNLSDVAIVDELARASYFAAFFAPAARANNTSVASAMERGAVVITNLDEHSPPELVHMENVLDINRLEALPEDPLVLRQLGTRAMETGRRRDWTALVERIRA
jgi:hypothetical protein